MKRLIAVIIIMFVLNSVLVAQPVYFADPDLKAAVEAELGVTNPTAADMLGLTTLYASSSNVYDLTGLEYATNLETLNISYNQISDISPLSGLVNLASLDLWDNQVANLSPLSGLTNLGYLYLSNNQINNISPLAGLTNLVWLNLMNNQISNISPLSGLTNLEQLNLSYNQINYISPLSGLTNLELLNLSYNQISDISPLAGLTNLDDLFLEDNPLNPDAFDIYIPQMETNGTDVSCGPTSIVPDVIGMSENDADVAITSLELGVSHTYQNSDTVPAGHVISQEPVAGKTVGVGFTMQLVVSLGPSGPDPVVVPDVVGMTEAAASSEITSAGLVVGNITDAYSSTVAEGHVISQNPAGGTSVPEGFYVNLTVSLGPTPTEAVEVPGVVGMSANDADSKIISAGLKVTHTHPDWYSDTVPEGHIIRQHPSAGTYVAEGSYVELTVSRGPRSGGGPSGPISPVPVLPNAIYLLAHWKLDDGSGNTAIDSSYNGHDITLHNTTWEDGLFGGAVHFNGVGYGDRWDFNYSNNAVTICAWVYHDDFRINKIERYVTLGPECAVIRKEFDGRLHFYIVTDGQLRHLWVDDVLTTGQWHHVAGTWDGLTQCLYIDGVEIARQTPEGTLGPADHAMISNSPDESLNGMLDDVRIYKCGLSESEIEAVMSGKESTVMLAGSDIGTTGGSDFHEDGVYTIVADGSDIGLNQDEFRYVYSIATGDFEISARVLSLENIHPSAKAGVMVRETLEAGSRNAFMCVTPEEGLGRLSFQSRSAGAGETTNSLRTLSGQVFYPFNTWLKIKRQGSIFTAFTSEDGITWEEFPGPFAVPASNSGSNPVVIEMPETAYVGLAVTSHSPGVLCTAEFDNVVIPTVSWPEIPDITKPDDVVRGVPYDGDWPWNDRPDMAIDDNVGTKYLHFKGDEGPSGLQITPSIGATVVTGLTFTTANDFAGRDPVAFELYGSNDSINGPYTLIASGEIVDFNQEREWPRLTMNSTMIAFENVASYMHYELVFTAIRGPIGGSVDSMQIAEIELLGIVAP